MKWRFGVFTFVLLLAASGSAQNFPSVVELPVREEFPDPLTMFNGEPVTTKKDWFKKRRPELKELFQHYEYGYFPPPIKIKTSVDFIDKNFYGGKATLKLVTIDFGQSQTPRINLMLVVPNQIKGKVPVFLGLNFTGNHSLVTDTNVPLATGWMNNKYPGVTNNRATDAARGTHIDTWAIEQSINRGYAVATMQYGEWEPDNASLNDGVRGTLRYQPKSKNWSANDNHDWGAIAAWAWGVQRAVDFLEKKEPSTKGRLRWWATRVWAKRRCLPPRLMSESPWSFQIKRAAAELLRRAEKLANQ